MTRMLTRKGYEDQPQSEFPKIFDLLRVIFTQRTQSPSESLYGWNRSHLGRHSVLPLQSVHMLLVRQRRSKQKRIFDKLLQPTTPPNRCGNFWKTCIVVESTTLTSCCWWRHRLLGIQLGIKNLIISSFVNDSDHLEDKIYQRKRIS